MIAKAPGKLIKAAVGARVVLCAFPGYLRQYEGVVGVVKVADPRSAIVEVDFDGQVVPVPLPYLADAPKEKTPRRSPLNLRAPADDRDEAQRLADGEREITRPELGYRMWRVGQGRASAICHRCSRLRRERGDRRPFVPMECADCREQNVKSLGFAPSTNSTPGVPDTFLMHPSRWPRYAVLPVEWKDGPHGERTPEQKELEALGVIVVVWDTPSLFEAVYRFECGDPRIVPHPALKTFIQGR